MKLLPPFDAFKAVFTDADLTPIQKIKQWINVVVYSCGKTVQRQERQTEASLVIAMNQAYYLRLQVIFEDVTQGCSYWAQHFDFDCTFAQMMTHNFGSGAASNSFFFDYDGNEFLDADGVASVKGSWTNPYLWKKYAELKTEMQGKMLPVLLKGRIVAGSDGHYEWKSGGSLAEVTWTCLGSLFLVHFVHFCVFTLHLMHVRSIKMRNTRSV
jgi:hypothetical protein